MRVLIGVIVACLVPVLAAAEPQGDQGLIKALEQGIAELKTEQPVQFDRIRAVATPATVQALNQNGERPIHLAAMAQWWDMVDLLLAKGSPITGFDRNGMTLLHHLVMANDPGRISTVLKAGAGVHDLDSGKRTPLGLAVHEGHRLAVEALLHAGADPLYTPVGPPATARYAGSALLLGLHSNKPDAPAIVALLLHTIAQQIELKTLFASYPEMVTASFTYYRGDVAMLVLPHVLPDLTLDTEKGTRLVHKAVANNNPLLIKALAQAGADLNAVDANKRTALMMSVRTRMHGTLRALLDQNVALELEDSFGQRVLHMACKVQDMNAVLQLLESGADITAKNRYGYTPLHVAAASGHLGLCDYLLLKGAPLNETDPAQKSVLAVAQERGSFATAAWLESRGATGGLAKDDLILMVARGRQMPVLHRLLADPELTPAGRNRLLRWACEKGEAEIAGLALVNGADVDAHPATEHPPLGLAALRNRLDIVDLLLRAGASVDEAGADGLTSLERTLQHRARILAVKDQAPPVGMHGQLLIIKRLIKAGALVDNAAVNIALSGGDREALDVLLANGGRIDSRAVGVDLVLATVFAGNPSVLETMVTAGVPLPVLTHNSELLERAVASRSADTLAFIIAKGGKLDTRDALTKPTALHRAAEQDLPDMIDKLLAAGADPEAILAFNAADAAAGRGLTPLLVALQHRKVQAARALLKAGVQVQATDPKGVGTLHLAVHVGVPELVKLAITKGCDVNQATTAGQAKRFAAGDTPLHFLASARADVSSIAGILIAAGADLEAKNAEGLTPYALARRQQHRELIAVLKRAGADLSVVDELVARGRDLLVDKKGAEKLRELIKQHQGLAKQLAAPEHRALHVLAERGDGETLGVFIAQQAPVDQLDASGVTPLISAIGAGQVAVVKALLSAGAAVNIEVGSGDKKTNPMLVALGYNPLGPAPLNGQRQTELVKILVAGGADPDANIGAHHRAIMLAAARGNGPAVAALLAAGADLKAADQQGRSLLLQFAHRGDSAAVAALLDHGANINGTNPLGVTALMQAAARGHQQLVELLIDRGAKANLKDRRGYNAIVHAYEGGWESDATPAIVTLLQGAGCTDPGIAPAVWRLLGLLRTNGRRADAVAHLAQHPDLARTWPKAVDSPLHEAIHRRYSEIVRSLLNAGIDPNTNSRFGYTALGLAIMRRDQQLVELLLQKGAKVNARNRGELTAVDLAEQVRLPRIAELLRRQGGKKGSELDKGF